MPILLVSAALHYQTKVWVEILLIQLHYQAKFCSTIFLALTALSSKILDDNIVSFSCTIKHKHLGPSRVIRKLFTGATSSDLAHYVIAMIQEGCYEQVIIHLSINDLLNRNSIENTVWNLQKHVVDIGQKFIIQGADKIYISGLIHTSKVSHILLVEVNCESNLFATKMASAS